MKRQIVDTLRDIREGGLISELDDAVEELVLACQRTGKVGQMTLTIKCKPEIKFNTMVLEDNLKVIAPQDPKATMFHVTDDMTLSLRNPRQPDLPNLDTVPGGIKVVDNFDDVKKVEEA